MSETQVGLRWIVTTLRAHAPLVALVGQRVYEQGSAPTNATHPMVLVNWQGGIIAREVGQRNLYSADLWVVRGVLGGGGASEGLAPIDTAIYDALHGESGSVSGGQVLTCTRVEQFRMAEPPVNGIVYRHLGGIYRLEVVAA